MSYLQTISGDIIGRAAEGAIRLLREGLWELLPVVGLGLNDDCLIGHELRPQERMLVFCSVGLVRICFEEASPVGACIVDLLELGEDFVIEPISGCVVDIEVDGLGQSHCHRAGKCKGLGEKYFQS